MKIKRLVEAGWYEGEGGGSERWQEKAFPYSASGKNSPRLRLLRCDEVYDAKREALGEIEL